MTATTLVALSRGLIMRRTTTAVIALLASSVLLAGCGDKDDPAPTSPSTSTPSTTPSQTPEEKAEAAAWRAYLKFAAVEDRLNRKPSIDLALKLAPTVATAPMDGYMVVGVQQYIDKGYRQVGDRAAPAQKASNVRSRDEVVLDVCLDNRGTDVVDKNGKSVVKAGHPKQVQVSVTVKKVKGTWLVSDRDGGTEAC